MKQRWNYRRQTLQHLERQEQQKRLVILAMILKEKSEVEKRERKDCIQEAEKALKYAKRIQ